MIPQSWSLFLGTFLGRVSFVSLHFSFILGCESVFTPRCPGAQAVAGTEPRCGRALFPALLPVRLFSPSFLEPRKWAQGCVQSQGAGQWQSPAFQPCSLALELSFLNAVTSCFLGGVAGRTRGARGHRVLLVTVFCFLFFLLGPRGVRVSALGAGSEVDISRVPSGAPSQDLGGEGSRTGPKGGAELRAGSTKPSHGGEGDTPGALGTPALREIFLLSAGEPQAPAPA